MPQELRVRSLLTPEEANRFLRRTYIREFNRRFARPALEQNETAFMPTVRGDLDRVFSIQTERTVNRDNTVKYKNMTLQIDKQSWRGSLEGSRVIVYQHFNETITMGYGHQQVGKYTADGLPIKPKSNIPEVSKRKAPPFSSTLQTGHIMC